MEYEHKVGCLFCEFKTKTKESFQQHMKSKHPAQASSYDEAMQMMGSPAMEVMVKTLYNLKEEKDEKEQIIKKLEKDLQAANDHLEIVKKDLEEKSKALENAKEEMAKREKTETEKSLNIAKTSNPNEEKEPINTETPKKTESLQTAESDTESNSFRNKICRYFNTNKGCKRGQLCHFKHETKGNGMDDCKFWMKGKCNFSDHICWNKHDPSKKGIKETKLHKTKHTKEMEIENQESESYSNLINILTQLLLKFALQSSAVGQ